MPEGAERFTRKGKAWVRWTGADGRKHEGRVSKNGDRVLEKSATYSGRFRDGAGILCEKNTGCKDRGEAMRVYSAWLARAAQQRAGLLTEREAEAADHARVPLVEHVDAYLDDMTRRDLTARHIKERRADLGRVLDGCNFRLLRDLNRSRFEVWLGDLARAGLSARRRNVYRAAMVSFSRWCVKTGRLLTNPLVETHAAKEELDRRHVRRALTEQELERLFEAAETRPVLEVQRITRGPRKGQPAADVRPEVLEDKRRLGRERALFYRVMAFTGLRFNEARTLRIGDLDLDGPKPRIQLRAEAEKNRKGATLPLRGGLAADLIEYLGERLSWSRADSRRRGGPIPARLDMDKALFLNAPSSVKVFDRDLAAANIAKHDARGRVADLHALRMTYCSLLAGGGVPLATAQVLMRHHSPTLTAKHYLDPAMLDTAGAVERLPDLDRKTARPDVARIVARGGGFSCQKGARHGESVSGNHNSGSMLSYGAKNPGFQGETNVCRGIMRGESMAGATGLEPATSGVTGRRSKPTELRPRSGVDECPQRREILPVSEATNQPDIGARINKKP